MRASVPIIVFTVRLNRHILEANLWIPQYLSRLIISGNHGTTGAIGLQQEYRTAWDDQLSTALVENKNMQILASGHPSLEYYSPFPIFLASDSMSPCSHPDSSVQVDDTDPGITYFGQWVAQTGPDFAGVDINYNGTMHVSKKAGDTATFKFTGISLHLQFSLLGHHVC